MITLDLKGYFHHLALHPQTQRWMRFWYNQQGYQIVGMPFGWSMSPFWAHRLAQPIRHVLASWGGTCLVGGRHFDLGKHPGGHLPQGSPPGESLDQTGHTSQFGQNDATTPAVFSLSRTHVRPQNEQNCTVSGENSSGTGSNAETQQEQQMLTPSLACLAGMVLDLAKSTVSFWGFPSV